ncbi:hypothetical protein [Armatimonas sp.]|uniref:hypothetical protein n=1 Tax=Armatimonas sp. TaxID=1872638 RepID=UPI00286ADA4D|nr:hypothetical protein [Armatimonas sp.]
MILQLGPPDPYDDAQGATQVAPGTLAEVLEGALEPVSLIATGGFVELLALLETNQALIRTKIARLFLVGGRAEGFLPIDPRLKERFPERFGGDPDPALGRLLTSGEGVIWLPGDVCLWRHWDEETQAATLLSTLPAFCLARHPEPMPWLRLFRAVPARVAVDEQGAVTELLVNAPIPNLYVVVAVDGAALSRFLMADLPRRAGAGGEAMVS